MIGGLLDNKRRSEMVRALKEKMRQERNYPMEEKRIFELKKQRKEEVGREYST